MGIRLTDLPSSHTHTHIYIYIYVYLYIYLRTWTYMCVNEHPRISRYITVLSSLSTFNLNNKQMETIPRIAYVPKSRRHTYVFTYLVACLLASPVSASDRTERIPRPSC